MTGDHPATAAAIAERVGILSDGVVDLRSLGMGPEAANATVLARATPEDKLTLVADWRRGGHVVAMTGDGVNDAPALRHADIGVAMGQRGTEVARQAADVVLADDELATLVAAVGEGRRVFANVRRFLLYGISGGVAEILVMLVGPFVGLAVPLLPAQILWVNLLTHGLAGTALGAEPADPAAMRRPPRPPAQSILGAELWQRIAIVGTALCVVSLAFGLWLPGDEAVVQSVVLLVLGGGQLGVAFGVRAPRSPGQRNPFLGRALLGAAALLVAAVTVPALQNLLGTAAPPVWAYAAASVSAVAAAVLVRVTSRPATW